MTVHTQRQGWFRFHQYHLQKCWSTGDIFLQQELSMKIMLRQFVEVNEASNATFYLYDNKWCKQQITIPHGQPPKELELFLIFKEMHNFCLTFCTSGWKLPINQYYHWYQMILRNFNGNLIVIGSASVEQWSMVIGRVLWLQLRLLQLEVLPLPLWRWRVKVSMGGGRERLCRLLQTFPSIRSQTFNFSTL